MYAAYYGNVPDLPYESHHASHYTIIDKIYFVFKLAQSLRQKIIAIENFNNIEAIELFLL